MDEYQKGEIQKGLAEIWRRQKLAIASFGPALPYGPLIMAPAYYYFREYATVPLLVLMAVFYLKVWSWVHATPCPSCGMPYYGTSLGRNCWSCGLRIKKPEGFDYKLSFKRINYKPLGVRNRSDVNG